VHVASLSSGEIAQAALRKNNAVIVRMKDAATRGSPQDAESLLEVLSDSLGELDSICKEIHKVSLVGSRIAAGVFNQGIKEQRRLVCDSTAAKSVKSTLEVCKPSLTHLFGDDDSKLEKALEAAKFSPGLQPYRPKAPFHFRSSDCQEGSDKRRKTPYSKPSYKKPSYKPRSSGKGHGPASKKGEGQQKK
jgi:hypothetical protein